MTWAWSAGFPIEAAFMVVALLIVSLNWYLAGRARTRRRDALAVTTIRYVPLATIRR